MVTYGFYNSVDHDRTYDATQVSELFDGLIKQGVYQYIGQCFMVTALSSGFQVSVGTGRAWFKHTWTKNDAALVLTLPAPPTLPDRYRCDAIVIDINADIKVRENKITYVKGEESADSNPPHPELYSGDTHYQVPLAYITREGREEEIFQSNINYVVGTTACPYVIGVLQEIDISNQVAEWNTAWDRWFSGKKEAITAEATDFHNTVTAAETSVNTDKAAFKAYVTEQVSELNIWINSQKSQLNDWKEDFDTWFNNLVYVLDGDVAGHLQNEIDSLTTRVTPIQYGGTGNPNGYIQTGFKNTVGNTIGKYATAEGMNTIASGEGAHAEGGGNYTMSEPVETTGMYGPDTMFSIIRSFDRDMSWGELFYDIDELTMQTGWNVNMGELRVNYGDENTRSHFPNTSFIPTTSNINLNGLSHCYFGLIVRDTSTNDILCHKVFCCGPDDVNNENYVGGTYTVIERDESDYKYQKYSDSDIQWSNILQPYDSDHMDIFVFFKNEDVAVGANAWVYSQNKTKFSFNECYGVPSSSSSNNHIHYVVPNFYLYNIAKDESRPEDSLKYQVELYFTADGVIEYLEAGGSTIIINGNGTIASGKYSHAEGEKTEATGNNAHSEGYQTIAKGEYSHAEGFNYSTLVDHSKWPAASGRASHVEGLATSASGMGAHAEGQDTIAVGDYSHSGGYNTVANGNASMSVGSFTEANGNHSFAGGYDVKACDDSQFTFGYDPRRQGISDELKMLQTMIFGLPGVPRYRYESYDETARLSSLNELNELLDKNRNGISICLKCPTTKNSLTYRTALPNDLFGTYLEFIDLMDGAPTNNLVAHNARILKLTPEGLFDAIKLNSDFDITSIVAISGNQYVYESTLGTELVITNRLDTTVSTSSVQRYIKYVLIRLF